MSASRLARMAALMLALVGTGERLATAEQPTPVPAPVPGQSGLTMDQAVAIALERNHNVIAAKLDIEAAELDRIAAGVYPNPTFSYTLGNLVLGSGNPQSGALPVKPGPFDQTVHSFGVSDVIDIWNKRGARIQVADSGLVLKRLQVEDALREIVRAVRTAYAEVLREQTELKLSRDVRHRHDETVRLSRARQRAGEISEAELRKVELEGLRYATAVISAEAELDHVREALAALMGLPPGATTQMVLAEAAPLRDPLSIPTLTRKALSQRADIRANKQASAVAEAMLTAARREALPDISLGVVFTHSGFTVSGDNPNALALTLSAPLPIFDRNQAGIGRARLEIRRATNEGEKLVLAVQHEVAGAVRSEERARAILDVYEGGMLGRSEEALKVAEKSYQAGAISLLELLEAQRTYLETRSDYLKARNVQQQARIDIAHAVGGNIQ